MLSSQPSSRNMESWKLISLSLSQNVFCQVNVKGVKTIVIIIVILTTLLSENRVLEIYFIVITIIIRHNCCLVNHYYNSLNSWKTKSWKKSWSLSPDRPENIPQSCCSHPRRWEDHDPRFFQRETLITMMYLPTMVIICIFYYFGDLPPSYFIPSMVVNSPWPWNQPCRKFTLKVKSKSSLQWRSLPSPWPWP